MISWRFIRDFGTLATVQTKPQNMRFSADQAGGVCRFWLGDYGIRGVGLVLGPKKGVVVEVF